MRPASADASSMGKSRLSTPSSAISRGPGQSVMITGLALTNASSSTTGQTSCEEVKQKMSALAKNAALSVTQPGKSKRSPRPLAADLAFNSPSSSPQPASMPRNSTPSSRNLPSASMKTSKPFFATNRPIAAMTGGDLSGAGGGGAAGRRTMLKNLYTRSAG